MILRELSHNQLDKTTDYFSDDDPFNHILLRKYLNHDVAKNHEVGCLNILIDGPKENVSKVDIYNLYITPEDRIAQARYFREKLFDGKSLPVNLFRYMHFMYIDTDKMIYPNNESVIKACRCGKLTLESDEYKTIVNLVKYSNHNVEVAHIIGLIQLIIGSVSNKQKEKRSIRLFIHHPKTGIHPKREAQFMSMYQMIVEELGTNSSTIIFQ